MKRPALTACAALVLLAALASCEQPLTVDQQIIATILEIENSIEAGERRPFMDYVAEDFQGQGGSLNRNLPFLDGHEKGPGTGLSRLEQF